MELQQAIEYFVQGYDVTEAVKLEMLRELNYQAIESYDYALEELEYIYTIGYYEEILEECLKRGEIAIDQTPLEFIEGFYSEITKIEVGPYGRDYILVCKQY